MSGKTIVVDYGIGNVFSVCNALKALGGEPVLTSDPREILRAERVLLPGVGAFGRAMQALNKEGIADTLKEFVGTGRPFLGICIGMQVLMESSTEFGKQAGLGLVSGEVCRVDTLKQPGSEHRVPHIGWSGLTPNRSSDDWSGTPLGDVSPGSDSVYFVHSFHCMPSDPDERIAIADYDGLKISAAIRRDNIFGVQFHPERSGDVGFKVLRSFLNL